MSVEVVLFHFGKVPGAKALFLPLVVVGSVYTLIGASNLFTNQGRFERLEQEYKESPSIFVQKEIVAAVPGIPDIHLILFFNLNITIG